MLRFALLVSLALFVWPALAKIPTQYEPVVIEAGFSFTKREFNLTAAVDRSKREGKPLYVYLGAEDCPPCKVYHQFLLENRESLSQSFSNVIVVDIRTWLNGPPLYFKVAEKSYSFEEFKLLVGDKNKALTYPYYWLLDPGLIQVKQLPQGSLHYMPLEKQIKILSIP